jgi:16S rRNA (adenine1518-N6/adenine1519-N6)-dimethyltransferase
LTERSGAHQARKRFGQHFLVDQGVLRAIVSAMGLRESDLVVEIGPGLAALTQHLLTHLPQMHAVELDRDLVTRLRKRFTPEQLIVHEADALNFDFRQVVAQPFEQSLATESPTRKLRIVGNLPYNISSPLLIRLIDRVSIVEDQHFMLQKEVVERLAAGPGQAAYGRLGVLLQAWYCIDFLFEVGPQAFDPPPRVDSAVFRMRPLVSPQVRSLSALEAVLAAGFGQRRKMLRGTLLPWLAARGVSAPEIAGTERAEEIPQVLWYQLADRLSDQSSDQRTNTH